MRKENTRGVWSPSIALTVQVGRGLLAVLFTGKNLALSERSMKTAVSSALSKFRTSEEGRLFPSRWVHHEWVHLENPSSEH